MDGAIPGSDAVATGLFISGATIIDPLSDTPVTGKAIHISNGRIEGLVDAENLANLSNPVVIDASGKYVIPGLLNANVHLFMDTTLENLVVHFERNRIAAVIIEAAQIALKNGVTTVFDTWGPRLALFEARDAIASGVVPGSRIFCGGNIIGLDGPYSIDFDTGRTIGDASRDLVDNVNALWAENVGPGLSWLTPEEVRAEIRKYIARGVNFLKYAASEHRRDPSAFLAFSPRVQRVIVEEAHRASLTAQSHSSSIEALHASVEAGCDLVQHCNYTGPTPIPDETLQLMVDRSTGAVVFPFTAERLAWMRANEDDYTHRVIIPTLEANCHRLISSGARLLLGTDGFILSRQKASNPLWSKSWIGSGGDHLSDLGGGHFVWFRAMEELGCKPMQMLRAATINIAAAYGKADELGSVTAGKAADLLILDKNPLEAAENYRSIDTIIKDGIVVDRAALPAEPVMTTPPEAPSDALLEYRARRYQGGSRFPCC